MLGHCISVAVVQYLQYCGSPAQGNQRTHVRTYARTYTCGQIRNRCFVRYAEWYQPPPDWAQSAVHEDTLVEDLLNLKHRQPSGSLADLCTVMMTRSPHGSLNWAKVPCDYPMFRAGVLCKRPAYGMEGSK